MMGEADDLLHLVLVEMALSAIFIGKQHPNHLSFGSVLFEDCSGIRIRNVQA